MKVIATRQGYYGKLRREEGEVFEIEKKDEFSKTWMEKFDETKKVKRQKPSSQEVGHDNQGETVL